MTTDLNGAVIAAGRGERLRAASGGLPKPLIELDGQPLVVRQVKALVQLGANPIHVIVNSETAALMKLREVRLPMKARLMVADTANSMESLLRLGERIESERFVLTTVDTLIGNAELARFVEQAQAAMKTRAVDGALGVAKWRGDQRPLFVATAADGTITRFGGDSGDRVTAGVYLFNQRIFAHAAAARAHKLAALREFLAYLLSQNMRFNALEMENVVDIDEAADLELARSLVGRRRSEEPQ